MAKVAKPSHDSKIPRSILKIETQHHSKIPTDVRRIETTQHFHPSAPHPQTIIRPPKLRPSLPRNSQSVATHIPLSLKVPTCSENPIFFTNSRSFFDALIHMANNPHATPTHSKTIFACTNVNAHRDKSHGHGVCLTCRDKAHAHIAETLPDLCSDTWWPVCRACGDSARRQTYRSAGGGIPTSHFGCSCLKTWRCHSCRVKERELAKVKNELHAASMRQFIGWASERGIVGGYTPDQNFLITGWKCGCGAKLGRDANTMMCAGCGGWKYGVWDNATAGSRAKHLTVDALKWV